MLDLFKSREHFTNHPIIVSDHISRFFPDDEVKVFHEILSLDLHMDVYFIESKKLSYNILITAGMSQFSMILDEEIKDLNDLKFAELMMMIPKNIKFGKTLLGKNPNDWIISMLKQTARFPHHENTWLGIGHTIWATYDLQPYHSSTNYVGGIVLPSATYDEDFTKIKVGENLINIYSFFPMYRNELDFKIQNGYNKFLDNIIAKDCKEIFSFKRENIFDN